MFDTSKLFKKRLRFSIKDDLGLFKLVKTYDPFQNKHKWADIQNVMQKHSGKPFSVRTIKERVTHLVKRYVTEDLRYNKAHATPEQWKAKSKLLADIVNLRIQAVTREGYNNAHNSSMADEPMDDFDRDADTPPPIQDYVLVKVESEDEANEHDNHKNGIFISEMDNTQSDDSFDEEDEKPLRPAKSKEPKIEADSKKLPKTVTETAITKIESSEALDYLTNRHQEELNLKKKRLAVEEKKINIQEKELALEREKFDLQKMERTQRLEIELKERELHMKVLEQQQQMIAMLLEQNKQG